MVDVITEIIINKPVEQVSQYVADPDNAPEWYKNIESAKWQTPKPLQVGSKIDFVAHFMGKELAYTYEITEYVPGQIMIMRTAEGPFPMQTTYTWYAESDEQTRMTLRNNGQPSGFSRLFSPFMAAMMRRANNQDLKNLKHILESN